MVSFLTARKMKFSIKNFLSKCDQSAVLLKKSLMENLFFSAVSNKYHILGAVFIRKSCLLDGGAYSNHVAIILNRSNNS